MQTTTSRFPISIPSSRVLVQMIQELSDSENALSVSRRISGDRDE